MSTQYIHATDVADADALVSTIVTAEGANATRWEYVCDDIFVIIFDGQGDHLSTEDQARMITPAAKLALHPPLDPDPAA